MPSTYARHFFRNLAVALVALVIINAVNLVLGDPWEVVLADVVKEDLAFWVTFAVLYTVYTVGLEKWRAEREVIGAAADG